MARARRRSVRWSIFKDSYGESFYVTAESVWAHFARARDLRIRASWLSTGQTSELLQLPEDEVVWLCREGALEASRLAEPAAG